MSKTFKILLIVLFCWTDSNADTDKFIINSNKAVSELELKGIKNIWEIIMIDYPRAKPVFIYSCNSVDFCLFDLNKDNKFVIVSSPLLPKDVKFTIDGVDQPSAIQKCFMKLQLGEANNDDSLRLFGGVFELAEDKECVIQIGSDINSGKYLVTVSKKIDAEQKKFMPDLARKWSWWEGSVVISFEPIRISDE